ncbi:MAG: hypothetical protein CFE21_04020 [Bacteroidetes bacterium B1(2017)]|nr:MAG: hypothetical protein CFE21_04020 [Bacteroidetes bacterium B1(2017)]
MKNVFFLSLILICSKWASAQDTLYRVDGRVQIVQILEETESQLKFKPLNGAPNLKYSLSKSEVLKIKYASGKTDVYAYNTPSPSTSGNGYAAPFAKADPLSANFKRRFINISIPDYFAGSITIAYEYFLKTGDYSIRVPLSVGLHTLGLNKFSQNENEYGRQSYYRESKIYSSGIECNYYPFGQGKAKYFVGPSIEFGRFEYVDNNYYSSSSTGPIMQASFQSLLLQNGFLFQPTREINFSVTIGLGYCRTRFLHKDTNNQYPGGDTYATNANDFAARWGLNLGYKF